MYVDAPKRLETIGTRLDRPPPPAKAHDTTSITVYLVYLLHILIIVLVYTRLILALR